MKVAPDRLLMTAKVNTPESVVAAIAEQMRTSVTITAPLDGVANPVSHSKQRQIVSKPAPTNVQNEATSNRTPTTSLKTSIALKP